MEADAPVVQPQPAPRSRPWLLWLGVPFVIAAGFAGGGVATCAYLAANAARNLKPETDTTVLRGTSAVVVAVRDLAKLETASFHMERVIDLRDRQSHMFGLFESEDAVLLVAAADVVAGVDLALLRDGDVRIDPDRHAAFITLPEPTILSVSLDNHSTYVHSRRTDMLAQRAQSLESRARQEAESSLTQAAIEAGILHRARENAARTIRALVQSFGFQRIEIEFQKG